MSSFSPEPKVAGFMDKIGVTVEVSKSGNLGEILPTLSPGFYYVWLPGQSR
jgi:hypothetical protein